ncbi:MAG: CPBP family glutamic-type intramembrane protease [Jaaginema sp. PMC 1079.18]|nr:CPBP family glutamic-type intramembrane protease [Jaaginema sp. PMC 1080.18]MEC4851172.1 CPBP family glutamic-type intramembrane protease [Jaaginema sp. PMC 1079.18]MEC4866125.1 CPBP family glutamic-type intramembrane protease [Jaaginema sp. PMC 1078.18]
MTTKTVWLTVKRVILVILTILVSITVLSSLLSNLNQPQVQSRLELYQTNIVLQASALPQEENPAKETFLGEKPFENAQKQYEEAVEAEQKNLKQLETQLAELEQQTSLEAASELGVTVANPQQAETLKAAIARSQELLTRYDVLLGLLQAQQDRIPVAQQLWQDAVDSEVADNRNTAAILQGIWRSPPRVEETAETILDTNLEGWFRDRALARLYTVQNRQAALEQLQTQQQQQAEAAFIKLAIIGGIPALGGAIGVGLLIFIIIQGVLKKEKSLIARNADLTWDVPWDAEIIWQVLIVGFFFVSQIFLPLFFLLLARLIGLDTSSFDLRQQVIFILISYLSMAGLGLLVLYISLKPYKPLPQLWFNFKLFDNWLWWGIGGYLVAVPLVVIVSILNQQIWQGQGGSNPILFLALQAQDTLALAIFFTTASIAAPIFEEIIFRGFLLPSLTRYLPVWGAILLSSVIFAIAHLSPSEILPLTVLGIVLGTTYTRSRNLLSSMLLHSLWNSGTLLSLFILGSR